MTRFNTGNPLDSDALKDLSDNAKNMDQASNSLAATYVDRLGRERQTLKGMQDRFDRAIDSTGFVIVDSFELGATIAERNQALRYTTDGRLYRWSGDLPKIVPAASTPSTTGGVIAGAWLEVSDLSLRQQLAGSGGSLLVGYGVATVGAALADLDASVKTRAVSLSDYGADSSGSLDASAAIQQMFDDSYTKGVPWIIPAGSYLINGSAPIKVRTSGSCFGILMLPMDNSVCWIEVARDIGNDGTAVSVTAWGDLSRGNNNISASNCRNKYVYIYSTEIASMRMGAYSNEYQKQERLRIDGGGISSTPLINSYASKASITATSYDYSAPITINNLIVRRVGATGSGVRGGIVVSRDMATLNSPQVLNDNSGNPAAWGIELSYCADVTLNKPMVTGVNQDGLGYGVIATGTIGCVIRDALIMDARHGVSGAYNVDLLVSGGVINVVDDHWGHRAIIENCTIYAPDLPSYCAIIFSGRDLTVNNVTQVGGETLVGVSEETLHLSGSVRISNITAHSKNSSIVYGVFGLSTRALIPAPSKAMSVTPSLPEYLSIENVSIHTRGASNHAVRLLNEILVDFYGLQDVDISKVSASDAHCMAVISMHQSTNKLARGAVYRISGIDCKGGILIYGTNTSSPPAASRDTYLIQDITRGSLRIAPSQCKGLRISGSSIRNVEQDSTGAWTGVDVIFSDCGFEGGAIANSLSGALFSNCVFSGEYTSFPASFGGGVYTSYVSMIGCLSKVTQPVMPTDLLSTVKPPYL